MGKADFNEHFQEKYKKIRDPIIYKRIRSQIEKIKANPELGKPMQYSRKGNREVYIGSLRLSYKYYPETDVVIFTDIYHKDEQ